MKVWTQAEHGAIIGKVVECYLDIYVLPLFVSGLGETISYAWLDDSTFFKLGSSLTAAQAIPNIIHTVHSWLYAVMVG